MTYNQGDLVRHPNRPEWGIGRVDSASMDGVVHVTFSKAGRKELHLHRVSFSLTKFERTRDAVVTYHREFLESLGKPYGGIRLPQKQRAHRVTHCYNCKSHLDNAVDIECVTCGWIVCWCGACGCGYADR